MEKGKGASRRGRKLASSRRRQAREPADGHDAPAAPGPESWPPGFDAELQAFFRDCGAAERGFVTREDLAEAKFSFLGSEEPQMIFDWVDTGSRGRLSLEEFSSGLKNVFGSGPSTQRLHTKGPLPSHPGSVTFSFPALEEADVEEKEAFLALAGQLGTGRSLSEQTEIWRLWRELRREEPQLAGNLEGFLAKMSSRLQEARADREALEWTLRKRRSDHLQEVRQLYEETEEQIRREKQQLQAQSDSRGMALSAHMQEALEAKEQEAQRLAQGQRELEAQLLHLSSTQQEASWENLQLREAERHLAGQLQEVRGQLQATRGCLGSARGRVPWQTEEEPSDPRENKAPDPQAGPAEEPPLPELFGDSDDWAQLLHSFGERSHRTLRLCWSPPPSPGGSSTPPTPRIVRQISISEAPALQSAQGPASDPEPGTRTPRGVPPGAGDRMGLEDPEGQDEQDGGLKQSADAPDLEAELEAPFFWGLPEAPAGESGNTGVLLPSEVGPSPPVPSPPQSPAASRRQTQAPDLGGRSPWPGPDPAKPPMEGDVLAETLEQGLWSRGASALPEGTTEPSPSLEAAGQAPTERLVQGAARQESPLGGLLEAHCQALSLDGSFTHPQGLGEPSRPEEGNSGARGPQDPGWERAHKAGGPEARDTDTLQQDDLRPEVSQAPAGTEVPAPGKMSPPPRDTALSGAGPAVGASEGAEARLTPAETQAQPGPGSVPAGAEGRPSGPQSPQPGPAGRPEDPRTAASSPGDLAAGQPRADPDYLFHVIFLGDSNVGKTSFLHLLHHDTFATGLTATVGVDFRVKSLLVDSRTFALQLWDTAGQERYHSLTRQLLRKAEGVVLMYDVTSRESFERVRYWLGCLQVWKEWPWSCWETRWTARRRGRCLRKPAGGWPRSLKMQEDRLKASLVEVPHQPQPKRAGCCR
ncbi:ras-related protein Rab-44 isoform X3 [Meriones unguiculatus]|uniref:ras-related protein Rab-44 isoform X3 n=1 Tax=Meriones unguiculatus TaxID=10047 RepID=UPI000B4EE456|nr:ras-related protein Rab-44 isoform X3 [Meriones unguiculatus]